MNKQSTGKYLGRWIENNMRKKNQRSRKTDKEPRKDIQRNSKKQTVAYEQRNE